MRRHLENFKNKNRLLNSALSLLVCLLALPTPALSNELLLFGGDGNRDYLGCLVCSEYRSDSVCNEFGTYGNEFGSNMWNEFSSPYGNEFSSCSPWNEFSTSTCVPVLVDRQGNFYGYFTVNYHRSNAVSFAENLNRIYKSQNEDVEKTRELICQILNR